MMYLKGVEVGLSGTIKLPLVHLQGFGQVGSKHKLISVLDDQDERTSVIDLAYEGVQGGSVSVVGEQQLPLTHLEHGGHVRNYLF